MVVQYNQQCKKCRKNYVLVSGKNNYPVCYDCQKSELHQEIKNKKMKKFFGIPEEFYKESQFLRNIKTFYIRYGELSEKQKEFFKKTVDKMTKQPLPSQTPSKI